MLNESPAQNSAGNRLFYTLK